MAKAEWGIEIAGGFFNEADHRYRDEKGTAVVSSTQVFDINGMSDFSMVDPADLEWKRVYGDAVHKAVEFLVQGDLDYDTLDDEIIAPVTGIEQRLRDMKFEVEATEEQQIVNMFGMKYGMRLDLRGTVEHQAKRRKAVIDLKTGSKFSKTWEWQVGGSYLFPQPKDPLGWLGIILQVDPKGSVTPHYVKDVAAAQREFQCLLATAILKLNNGFSKLGG